MIGIFGVQGRIPKKISEKQIKAVQNLDKTLKNQTTSFCAGQLNRNESFLNLLSKILNLNAMARISPAEVLRHEFLRDN